MSRRTGLGAICALLVAGSGAFAEPVGGSVYVCPSQGGLPAVRVEVGRVETSAELGVPERDTAFTIVHVQARIEEAEDSRLVGHMPFDVEALAGCDKSRSVSRLQDGVTFQEGYQIWRTAFDGEGAGFFTVAPGEAYWMALGIVPEAGVQP